MIAPYNFALEKAMREREVFLKEYPEMQMLQDELTRTFDDFGDDPETNMEIISEMMTENIKKLIKIKQEIDDA